MTDTLDEISGGNAWSEFTDTIDGGDADTVFADSIDGGTADEEFDAAPETRGISPIPRRIIVPNVMIPEIREVRNDGTIGEILPDWSALSYLDDSADIGTVQIDYAENGIRSELLVEQREYALFIDGDEVDNSRFILDEDAANRARDTPGMVTWSGRTYLARAEEAIVVGKADKGTRLDQHTVDEALVYAAESEEYIDEQLVAEQVALGRANLQTYPDGREEVELDTYPNPAKDVEEQKNSSKPPQARTFKEYTAGRLVLTLINEARKRGALAHLRTDFSSKYDSAGVPWAYKFQRTPDIGSSILDLLVDLRNARYAEPRVKGRTLQLFNSNLGDPDTPRAEFALGKNLLDGPEARSTGDLVTRVYVVSDKGPHGWVSIPSLESAFEVIEAKLDVEGVTQWDTLFTKGRDFLLESARVKMQNTFGIVPRVEHGTVPYRDFGNGDWVSIDKDGRPSIQRVRAITLSWDANRTLSAGITCNDRLYERGIVRYTKAPKAVK